MAPGPGEGPRAGEDREPGGRRAARWSRSAEAAQPPDSLGDGGMGAEQGRRRRPPGGSPCTGGPWRPGPAAGPAGRPRRKSPPRCACSSLVDGVEPLEGAGEPLGIWVSSAPDRSAPYSRERDTDSWMMVAAMGARMADSSSSGAGTPSSSSPPNIDDQRAMLPRKEMAPPMVAAMVPMSMSRLVTWLISWARTPRSWRSSMMSRMPVVTATAAWLGLRPVANALGSGRSMRYRAGIGMPARPVRSRTMRSTCGCLARPHRACAVGLERDAVAEPVDAHVEHEGERRAR